MYKTGMKGGILKTGMQEGGGERESRLSRYYWVCPNVHWIPESTMLKLQIGKWRKTIRRGEKNKQNIYIYIYIGVSYNRQAIREFRAGKKIPLWRNQGPSMTLWLTLSQECWCEAGQCGGELGSRNVGLLTTVTPYWLGLCTSPQATVIPSIWILTWLRL